MKLWSITTIRSSCS